MNPGGGHEKNNPRRGKKSPARGDKQREKKAGRKRIGREYRKKGVRELPLPDVEVYEDFNEKEFNVLFNLKKKKAYGEDSTNLDMVVKMRGTKPSLIPQFIESFKRKLEQKNWGRVYEGGDDKTYVSLNLEKKENIEMFIQINRP